MSLDCCVFCDSIHCVCVCEYRSKYDKGLEEWRQLCDKQAGELRQLRDDRQELTNQLSGHHVNIGKLESDVSTFLISLQFWTASCLSYWWSHCLWVNLTPKVVCACSCRLRRTRRQRRRNRTRYCRRNLRSSDRFLTSYAAVIRREWWASCRLIVKLYCRVFHCRHMSRECVIVALRWLVVRLCISGFDYHLDDTTCSILITMTRGLTLNIMVIACDFAFASLFACAVACSRVFVFMIGLNFNKTRHVLRLCVIIIFIRGFLVSLFYVHYTWLSF